MPDPFAQYVVKPDPFAAFVAKSDWQPGLEMQARTGPHEMTDAPDQPPTALQRLIGSEQMQRAAHPQSVADIGSLVWAGNLKNLPVGAVRGPVGRSLGAVGQGLESLGQSDAASHLGTAGAMTELWRGNIPGALVAAGAPRIVTGTGKALKYVGGKIAGAPPPSIFERYAPNTGGLPAAAGTAVPNGPRLTTWSNAYAPAAEQAAGELSPEIEQELLRRGIQPSRVLDVQPTTGANRVAPRMAPPPAQPMATPSAPPVSPAREQELLQQFGGRGPAAASRPMGPATPPQPGVVDPQQAYLRDLIENPRPKPPWTPEAAKARLEQQAAEQWHSGSESGGPYAARDAAGHKMDAELDHWYRYHLENPTSAIALASSPAAIRALLMERMNGNQQVSQ